MRLLMVFKVSVLALAVGLYGCKGTDSSAADAASTQDVVTQVAEKLASETAPKAEVEVSAAANVESAVM